MTIESVRLADMPAAAHEAPPPLDRSPLVGAWRNTHDRAQGLARLEVSEGPGGLTLEAVGAGPGSPGWRFERARAYRGLGGFPEACGLTAERTCDGHRMLLQGNLNLGLLVLCTFRAPLDRGGLSYFAREFFAPGAAPPEAPPEEPGPPARPATRSPGRGEVFAGVPMPERVDPAPMIGRWRNAERGTKGIREIHIEARPGGGLAARVLGAGPAEPFDWGVERVSIFACVDEAGGRSLAGLAVYDFGFMESHLQLRVPSGTLAVAGFNVFKDGSGRSDYATREFFYR